MSQNYAWRHRTCHTDISIIESHLWAENAAAYEVLFLVEAPDIDPKWGHLARFVDAEDSASHDGYRELKLRQEYHSRPGLGHLGSSRVRNW